MNSRTPKGPNIRHRLVQDYPERLDHLHTDVSSTRWSSETNHRAPHKPLLLMAVMDLFA
jgi:hypothetical protein